MDVAITPAIIIVFGIACFLIGVSKGGLGGALGFLITPLMALVMPLNKVVGLMLPVLMIGDVFTLAFYWRKWDARLIWILLAGALVGVTLATFVLVSLPPDLLKKGLAVLVLLFLAYRLLEKRILAHLSYRPRPWHGLLAGSTAGFASTLAHAGGPPITIYMLLQRLDPTVFIATIGLFFTVLNWIKVPYYLFSGLFDFRLILALAWVTPLIPVGVWAGKTLAKRIDKKVFETVVIILLGVSAVLLLVG